MIDFILFIFVCIVFAVGFWCGKTFLTYKDMLAKAELKVRGWLS